MRELLRRANTIICDRPRWLGMGRPYTAVKLWDRRKLGRVRVRVVSFIGSFIRSTRGGSTAVDVLPVRCAAYAVQTMVLVRSIV